MRDGVIVTPAADGGDPRRHQPQGRSSRSPRDLGYEVVERDLARAELYLADEVFITGTAAELVPVREIDDHAVGTGKPGEMTRGVQSAFHDALYGRTERYREWLDPVPVDLETPVGDAGGGATSAPSPTTAAG